MGWHADMTKIIKIKKKKISLNLIYFKTVCINKRFFILNLKACKGISKIWGSLFFVSNLTKKAKFVEFLNFKVLILKVVLQPCN